MLPRDIPPALWRCFTSAPFFTALVPMVLTAPAHSAADHLDTPTGLTVAVALLDDWGSGACGEGSVTNNSSSNTLWAVTVELPGLVTNYWNSTMQLASSPSEASGDALLSWRVTGAAWNQTLAPDASTTFGFCIDRDQQAQTPPAEAPDEPATDPHSHEGGAFIDLATFGTSSGSDHTGHEGLVGGRTAITTEALLAYNQLRAFVGLEPATLEEIGSWAFANSLTNNAQAWGNDQAGVGLWYAMQGAKVGWMADAWFDPQVVADIERTARLGSAEDVMALVTAYGHDGFADYLTQNGYAQTFINTLKMEPHYGGWMHDKAHGYLSIEGVAIAHDVNHLTVLSHDQMQPFMNDTWDWPQWPALEVSQERVLEYFQSMVVLGDPRGFHLEDIPPADQDDPQTPPSDDPDEPATDPHPHDDSGFVDLTTFGASSGSDHTGHEGLVGGRTAITTEALLAYNQLRAFVGLEPATLEEVGAWAFANSLTNNAQAWGNDQLGVGLWYAMQGAKVGWMADDQFDPQVVADIERTARLGSAEDVMTLVAAYGHDGFADYLTGNGYTDTFINTLKMEPHYGGWMHDRAHGYLPIEDVAIAHDVNHLTVLSHDQMQPFMNDTWDWPQWPALDVSQERVLEYFQSMVVLGDPLGFHLEHIPSPEPDDPVDIELPPGC